MQDVAFSQQAHSISIENSKLADPIIKYDEQRKVWILTETYTYQSEGFRIIIKEGFEFDLASVPRAFWWAISPFDLSITAPLIHDFLYIHRGKPPQGTVVPFRTFTRLEADRLFDRRDPAQRAQRALPADQEAEDGPHARRALTPSRRAGYVPRAAVR